MEFRIYAPAHVHTIFVLITAPKKKYYKFGNGSSLECKKKFFIRNGANNSTEVSNRTKVDVLHLYNKLFGSYIRVVR